MWFRGVSVGVWIFFTSVKNFFHRYEKDFSHLRKFFFAGMINLSGSSHAGCYAYVLYVRRIAVAVGGGKLSL